MAEESKIDSGKPDTSRFLPWVEKYRPSSLSELSAQADIINTITRLIAANRLPHLLFYGPPGTGKTTCILALAKMLYGAEWQSRTLELNASDERGIDVVREKIKVFAGSQQLFASGVKLVILDEADAMTSDAQFALRREDIRSRLMYVAEKESLGTRLQTGGADAILRLANGDMRRVLNVLQATASGFEVIDEDAVYACTGNPRPADIRHLLETLLKAEYSDSFGTVMESMLKGYALTDVVTELSKLLPAIALPPEVRILLLDKLADIEYRLAFGTSDKIQGAALVAAFQFARELATLRKTHT